MEDKYVGLFLAIVSTIAIGGSYVITKIGLRDAADRNGFDGEGHEYLKNPIWWAGMLTNVLGEIANFAAYAFAPAILVTPLGALTVLTGAIFGAYFLKERLGRSGQIGCALCLVGSVIIASHAPPDEELETVDQILEYALRPGFLIYCLLATVISVVMIYRIAPKYGKTSPLYYLTICAATGSISVMAIKALGIALKLTFRGQNQFTHASTYCFIIVSVVCILCQMNYLNKALNEFSQSIVNPIYYVFFTTAVLVASFLLYQGFNTTSTVNTISLICGFIVIFLGTALLNQDNRTPEGHQPLPSRDYDGMPTDPISDVVSRYSMHSRRSMDHRRSISGGSVIFSPTGGVRSPYVGDRDRLMGGRRQGSISASLEEGSAFGLHDLAEDGESTSDGKPTPRMNGTPNINGSGNGSIHTPKLRES